MVCETGTFSVKNGIRKGKIWTSGGAFSYKYVWVPPGYASHLFARLSNCNVYGEWRHEIFNSSEIEFELKAIYEPELIGEEFGTV